MNFYPKPGQCKACVWLKSDCSKLPFSTMAVHRRDGQDIVVKCNQFKRHIATEDLKK